MEYPIKSQKYDIDGAQIILLQVFKRNINLFFFNF